MLQRPLRAVVERVRAVGVLICALALAVAGIESGRRRRRVKGHAVPRGTCAAPRRSTASQLVRRPLRPRCCCCC
eukprot:scaffold2176_cov350-Prasinococcus_capsulatus_cf.AAC.8